MSNTDYGRKILLGICGTGGFAREIVPMAENFLTLNSDAGAGETRVVFVGENPTEHHLNDAPVVSEVEFFDLECEARYFNIAISDSKIRKRIALDFIERGATPFSILSPNSIAYAGTEIAEGAIICANSMITSNAQIGRFFHSNFFSYVAHDCVIGDFVTFAPRVNCLGNVHIGDHAYIGAAATLKQGSVDKPLLIGEGAVVGMGAVVTKDVPAFTTVIGNPAKPLVKK